jgi:hypothetical protein
LWYLEKKKKKKINKKENYGVMGIWDGSPTDSSGDLTFFFLFFLFTPIYQFCFDERYNNIFYFCDKKKKKKKRNNVWNFYEF